MQTSRRIKTLADIGRKIFPVRLAVGLLAVLAGRAALRRVPFFTVGYRMVHAFAVALISAGLALRAWGTGSAGDHTRSGIIEAPELSTAGPFAYVRNPIYAGSIVIGFGMASLLGDPLAYILSCARSDFFTSPSCRPRRSFFCTNSAISTALIRWQFRDSCPG